ncbi:MAG TPA: hypothetical protein VEH76_01990 [Methylocystis sp.]|nr:hypothetical protein [Methylocystis sp.]
MFARTISMVSGAAVVALAMTASAAPLSIVSPESVVARPPIEKVAYCHRVRHHWRCHESRPRCPRYYGYSAPVPTAAVAEEPLGYYGYSAPAVTAPVVEAAPAIAAPALAAEALGYYGYYGYSAPVASAPVVAADGIYCTTSVKTCLLQEPGWLGTGCSCRVPGGYARGVVE